VVVGGKIFRRIDARCWDVERRLADMAADHVTIQVLSPMPELLSYWLPAEDTEHLARILNEQIASMVADAPGNFIGIGMVCAQDVRRAVSQLEDVKAAGLVGIELGTHIDGTALGAASLDPLYEAAESLGLCLFVHPLHPIGLDRIAGSPVFEPIAAFPLETAFAAVSLLAGRIPERFPKLRILLSHGGGALPWILPRMDFGWSLGGPFQEVMQTRPTELARRFWFDSIVYEPEALRFMSRTLGTERMVIGSDYPFLIRQDRPVAFVEEALGECNDILHRNAMAFLYGTPADVPAGVGHER
jgi:aminocarboxymuconate-semialdehyde decarboxylase